MYGDALSHSDVVQDASISAPTDTINNHFRPLVQRGDVEELRWLRSIFAEHSHRFRDINPDIWDAFREAVVNQHGKTDAETRNVLEELASEAGVDLPEDEAADSTDEED
jgi:hypothetical protein